LATRNMGGGGRGGDPAAVYFSRNPNSPFQNMQDLLKHPDYAQVRRRGSSVETRPTSDGLTEDQARDELMINVMKVMADYKLDAIVHKSVEHTPTLIKDGINPPYVNHKGAPHLNTFLIYAASIAVPAGFTPEGLPAGITFFGRPYSEPVIIKFAYAYEQATHHRRPPSTTPALPAKMASAR
jgi:amidase